MVVYTDRNVNSGDLLSNDNIEIGKFQNCLYLVIHNINLISVKATFGSRRFQYIKVFSLLLKADGMCVLNIFKISTIKHRKFGIYA